MGLAIPKNSDAVKNTGGNNPANLTSSLPSNFLPSNVPSSNSRSPDSGASLVAGSHPASSRPSLFHELRDSCIVAAGLVFSHLVLTLSSSFETQSSAELASMSGVIGLLLCIGSSIYFWMRGNSLELRSQLKAGQLRHPLLTALAFATILFSAGMALWGSNFQLDATVINVLNYGAASALALTIFSALRHYFGNFVKERCSLNSETLALTARVQDISGQVRHVAAHELSHDERCMVQTGEFVPCDGEVLEGCCVLRERRHTGLKFVRVRGAGQRVIAGSQVISGSAVIRCDQSIKESLATSFFERVNQQLSIDTLLDARSQTLNIVYGGTIFLAVCFGLAARELGFPTLQAIDAGLGVLLTSMLLGVLILDIILPRLAIRKLFDSSVLLSGIQILEQARKSSHLAIDFTTKRPPGIFRVTELRMIDERVERNRLESAMHAIFCACDDELAEAFAEYLERAGGTPVPCQATEVQDYPGLGIAAKIDGIDCSIGSEEFLIERGVGLVPTETIAVDRNSQVAYVALDDMVVAYFVMNDPFLHDGRELKSSLDKLGIGTWLWSQDQQKKVDDLARASGFELGRVFGDLTPAAMQAKLQGLGAVALYAHRDSDRELIRSSSLSISHFDELRWDLDRSDVILVGRELWPINVLFVEAKRVERLLLEARVIATATTLICLTLILTSGISSAAVAAASLGGAALIALRCIATPNIATR